MNFLASLKGSESHAWHLTLPVKTTHLALGPQLSSKPSGELWGHETLDVP